MDFSKIDWNSLGPVVSVPLVPVLVVALLWVSYLNYLATSHLKAQRYNNDRSLMSNSESEIPIPPRDSVAKLDSNDDEKRDNRRIVRTTSSYRMEEVTDTLNSSEYSVRGRIWNSRPSWHIPSAPRQQRLSKSGLDHVLAMLATYEVDPLTGFLPSEDPLQRLPFSRYHIWEDLADDLPKLLCARLGQARDPLRMLPVLNIDRLATARELRRAHLILCLFAHAFVWGGPEPLDYIPEGIARPLSEVSEKLGIPPILGHPSIVLFNWRRFDQQVSSAAIIDSRAALTMCRA